MNIYLSGELIKIENNKITIQMADNSFTSEYLNKLNYTISNGTFTIKIKKKICFINERLAPLEELLYRQVKIFVDIKKYQIKNKDWISGYTITASKISLC
jgi:hypothetical protein